jgi:ankyrin repeat protein
VDIGGYTALMDAVVYNLVGMVKLLLESGRVDLTIESKDGHTVLDLAAHTVDNEITDLLVAYGCKTGSGQLSNDERDLG